MANSWQFVFKKKTIAIADYLQMLLDHENGFLLAEMDKKLHRAAFDRCSLNEKYDFKIDFLMLLGVNFQFFLFRKE